jgi:hypothetical protein
LLARTLKQWTKMTAMRRIGDREGEWITGRSYGCGSVLFRRPEAR